MRALVWFRSDLRVRDNTALDLACRRATDGVVGVFAVCPEQWLEHDWGAPRVDFLLRSLRALGTELAERNIPLRIVATDRFDGVPAALTSLAECTGCTALFYNREYEVNEVARDESVSSLFAERGRAVRACTDKVIFAPGEVLTKQGAPYTVYSPFKKNWRARYLEGDAPSAVGLCKKQPEIDVRPDPLPESIEGFNFGEIGVRPDLWEAGEQEAKRRLDRFVESRIGDYKEHRDLPAISGTSTLSPYLAHGVISPRQCVEAALGVNQGRIDSGDPGVIGWIEELIWREFYQHVIAAFPRVCKGRAFRTDMDRVEWSHDQGLFDAWREGRTGYPIVDAAMRQLAQTGWMHNRLRMIVAMFLTKDLMIDWRWGERHFMNRLVDGDFASNNGGWQWSASTGTDAQPYFRIFNPTTQGEKFDRDGEFIRRFVPELSELPGKAIHDPSSAGLFGELDYPDPIVDHRAARETTLARFKALAAG